MQPEQPQVPQAPQAPVPSEPQSQPVSPILPQQPVPQQLSPMPNANTPIYQADCWVVPKGHYGTWRYKHCRATIVPGLVTIQDSKTGEEYIRYQLTPDLQIGRILGWARFKQVNGKKMSLLNIQSQVMLSDIKSLWLILGGTAIEVVGNIMHLSSGGTVGRYNLLYVLGFGISIVGFIWHFAQAKRAKAFVAACKHGAGIAN